MASVRKLLSVGVQKTTGQVCIFIFFTLKCSCILWIWIESSRSVDCCAQPCEALRCKTRKGDDIRTKVIKLICSFSSTLLHVVRTIKSRETTHHNLQQNSHRVIQTHTVTCTLEEEGLLIVKAYFDFLIIFSILTGWQCIQTACSKTVPYKTFHLSKQLYSFQVSQAIY